MTKAATPIVLSEQERETLEGRLRAGSTEQRHVERARIILAADEGVGTNKIAQRPRDPGRTGREVADPLRPRSPRGPRRRPTPRCPARLRPRDRATHPRAARRGPAVGSRHLDRAPAGQRAGRRQRGPRLAGPAPPRHQPATTPQLVLEHRSRVRRQGRRHRGALSGPTRERDRHLRRREALDPGARAGPGLAAVARREERSPASPTSTSAMEPRRCSPPSRSPPAWSRRATTSDAVGASSSTS